MYDAPLCDRYLVIDRDGLALSPVAAGIEIALREARAPGAVCVVGIKPDGATRILARCGGGQSVATDDACARAARRWRQRQEAPASTTARALATIPVADAGTTHHDGLAGADAASRPTKIPASSTVDSCRHGADDVVRVVGDAGAKSRAPKATAAAVRAATAAMLDALADGLEHDSTPVRAAMLATGIGRATVGEICRRAGVISRAVPGRGRGRRTAWRLPSGATSAAAE